MRGREQVWNAVTSLLRSGRCGQSGVLLIDGAAGMGKSLLIAAAARAAAAWNFSTAIGGVRGFGRITPLEPLLSAIGCSAVFGGARGEGAARWPWIVDDLRCALERRAADGPVLVGLDDLQRADPETLTAVEMLSRRLTAVPLVWLLARRTSTCANDAGRLFDLLERDGASRFTLTPLDDTALREVAADILGAPPGRDLLALASEAGGDPALITELLSGLRDEGTVRFAARRARLAVVRLPARVQVAVDRRLDEVSLATRHLLNVTAILGRSFVLEDAAELLGTTPAALLPQIDEALSSGVLVVTGDEVSFQNGLLWRVILDTMPAPIRQALHRQAGGFLIGRGGPAALPAAAHLIQGVRAGDVRALDDLDRAIAEVLTASPRAAADLAVNALRLTGHAEAAWPARAVTAVRALTAAGRLDEAAELVESALLEPLAGEPSARLRCLRSGILNRTGRTAEALAEADLVLAEPDLSVESRDEADLALINARAAAGDDAGVRERVARVLPAAGAHSDALVTGALITLALSEWGQGRLAEGLRLAREAVRRATSVEARRLHPRMVLGMLLTDVRRLEEARRVLASAGEDAEMTGHLAWAAAPAVLRARFHLAAGRFRDAVAEAEAGLALTRELGPHVLTSSALSVLATATLRIGDLNAAHRYLEGDLPVLSPYGSPYAMARFVLVRTQVAVAREGPAAAAEPVGRLCDELVAHCWTLISEPTAAPWLVRTALALGDRERAGRVVAAMDRLAGEQRDAFFANVAVTAAHARGLLERDRPALRRAAAEHADPWARASAAEDLGALCADGGPELRRDAVASLDAALMDYSALGAARDAARVRRRLRRLGVRRRHWRQADRPASGWASLTDTERSVSTLVAQGLTNRQVADRLFMSVHTVAFHLRHVFRKLGVTSRVELTRLAVEDHSSSSA